MATKKRRATRKKSGSKKRKGAKRGSSMKLGAAVWGIAGLAAGYAIATAMGGSSSAAAPTT